MNIGQHEYREYMGPTYNNKFHIVTLIVFSIRYSFLLIGFFSIDLILPAALGPGVYSASNRNEYQELIK
jgi:hypothetical protein